MYNRTHQWLTKKRRLFITMAKQTQIVDGNNNATTMIQHNTTNNVSIYMAYIKALEAEAERQYQEATNTLVQLPEMLKVGSFQKWMLIRDVLAAAKNLLQ